jgi:hypothetical protein
MAVAAADVSCKLAKEGKVVIKETQHGNRARYAYELAK